MTKTTHVTRRAALAGSVALPILPAALAQGSEPDPAVAAFEEWRAAYDQYNAIFRRPGDLDDDDPELLATEEAERAAALKLVRIVPTTLAGVHAQLAFAHYVFGNIKLGHHGFALDAFEFSCWLKDDRESDLLRSLMAGVERMAGGVA